jgi:hypothetical protein
VNSYSSLLSLRNGLELVRKFAMKKKITMRFHREEFWWGDQGTSYIFLRGMKEMSGDA